MLDGEQVVEQTERQAEAAEHIAETQAEAAVEIARIAAEEETKQTEIRAEAEEHTAETLAETHEAEADATGAMVEQLSALGTRIQALETQVAEWVAEIEADNEAAEAEATSDEVVETEELPPLDTPSESERHSEPARSVAHHQGLAAQAKERRLKRWGVRH